MRAEKQRPHKGKLRASFPCQQPSKEKTPKNQVMVEVTLEDCCIFADFEIKCRSNYGLDVGCNGHYVGHWMEAWQSVQLLV